MRVADPARSWAAAAKQDDACQLEDFSAAELPAWICARLRISSLSLKTSMLTVHPTMPVYR